MTKMILFALALCSFATAARAQQTVMICTQIPGSPVSSCQPVSPTNPLPVTIGQ